MEEMTPREFRDAAERSVDWVEDYRRRLEDHPVLAQVEPGDVAGKVAPSAPEEGEAFGEILADLDEVVVPGLTHWNHPGFFAYFPSSSSPPAVLAELVAAAVNQNAMVWRASPAATELEERMVDWIRQLVGLPDDFGGVIQDTASTGSFTALVAAREALGLEVRRRGLAGRPELPALALYVSSHTHSSLEKAAVAAGLGQDSVRRVPVDDAFRMEPGALARRMEEDRREGWLPAMVCATIGTTSTASVDPVAEIAEVCREHDVWLHVDAAYAGPAAMLPELAHRFEGWEEADSLVLNPHKWLATPLDCSLLLFRDPDVFRRSLALTPEYLSSDEAQEGRATDLMDYGLPLGRRFRALKLWFLLRWHGAQAIRERLRRHIRWARDFARRVKEDARFEMMAPPSFSTVCFRAFPPEFVREGGKRDADGGDPDREAGTRRGRPGSACARPGGEGRGSDRPLDREGGVDTLAANQWNRLLLDRVNREGRAFLTHTELAGSRVIRLSVGSIHTRQQHVSQAWEAIARAYGALAAERRSGRD